MQARSNSGMAFVLGAVVVLLGGVIWYIASDGDPFNNRADIQIELPKLNTGG